MAIVVPDEGELFLLSVLLIDSSTGPFHLHLYANNYDPNKESVLLDFVEATFSGYDVVELDRSTWTAPATVGGYAQSTYGLDWIIWLATSGTQQVFGYYVTDDADSVVLWAERFAAPMTVTSSNPAMVLPVLRLRSELQPEP